MKIIELRFKFQWNLFPGVQLTISQHWFIGNGLAPSRRWPADLIHWRIYAALGGDELNNRLTLYTSVIDKLETPEARTSESTVFIVTLLLTGIQIHGALINIWNRWIKIQAKLLIIKCNHQFFGLKILKNASQGVMFVNKSYRSYHRNKSMA